MESDFADRKLLWLEICSHDIATTGNLGLRQSCIVVVPKAHQMVCSFGDMVWLFCDGGCMSNLEA